MKRMSFGMVLFLVGVLGLMQCGGGGKAPSNPPVGDLLPTISHFSASPASMVAGASSQLGWTVSPATGLSIDQGVPAISGTTGSVTVSPAATTLYTLTATIGTHSVTATTTVTVTPAAGVVVAINPTSATVQTSKTLTLLATVTGTANTAVTWRVQESSGGAVTPQGLYTAPAAVGIFHVIATSVADPLKSAVATLTVTSSAVAGSAAAGSVPTPLPTRLSVGLMEEPGATWMKTSGVPWDMRYHYFTVGWRNNWGYDSTNSGQWGLSFFKECDALNTLPVVQFYCMNDEPGGGEAQFYSKTQNATTMASYFDDFKVLMQRCKDFGKPVLVIMEGDGFAYMEIQSKDNPDAPSAIASTGMAELKDLPNTAAGWGLAFLQLRKAVGASNVVLGIHVSAWATLQDVSYVSTTLPLQPEVDKAYAFLSKLGLAANVTGQTYDVLVGDPLDRDSDYYRLNQGQDRWWDASDSAPITSKSLVHRGIA